MAIVPKEYAEDFYNFAKGNSGAIPLLYKSKPGEFQAPPLCEDSDIRVEVPLYTKIVNGKIEGKVKDLLGYDMSNYVSFYIGCSYSFNDLLLLNKIMSEKDMSSNVSMYVSGIDCYSSGKFSSKMVVSVRAVNKSKLSLMATLCESLHDVHGPPIHYGNPKAIGIYDLENFQFGDKTHFQPDEVPVFFCCGVTGLEALKSAKIDLTFTHAPGCMFVTDVIQEKVTVKPSNLTSRVESYNEKSSLYSSLSQNCVDILRQLDAVLQQDLGDRKISHLVIKDDFLKAALALSHASSVAMVTGFPAHLDNNPPDETDGLPGIISLAAVLQSLGKKIILVVDDYAYAMNVKLMKRLVEEGLLKDAIEVLPYVAGQTRLKNEDGVPFYDVILASERVGRSKDGKYYSMKGRDLSSRVSPIDDLFLEAAQSEDITTISIGDGGNELGMGKVLDKIRKHIPLGETIGCSIAADLLIAAGVSNWGCYGLGVALYSLRSCPVHDRYYRRAVGFPTNAFDQMKEFLPSIDRERKILEVVESFGIKDGIKPNEKMSVDGMLFDREHTDVLRTMLKLVTL